MKYYLDRHVRFFDRLLKVKAYCGNCNGVVFNLEGDWAKKAYV